MEIYKKNSFYILQNVYNNFIKTNIINEDTYVIIALSGGKDSMCLLDVMKNLSLKHKFKICAFHIHHGIRDREADRDLDFVINYCNINNIELIYEKVESIKFAKEEGLTLEESARILRYKALENAKNILKEKHRDFNDKNYYIALAHHKKDQAETIIFNMLRGSGIKGMIGMKYVRDMYIRPLLNIDKDQIDNYIDENDLPFVFDTTNDDINYSRNFIRKEILPRFENLNKQAITHIADLSYDIEMSYDYIYVRAKFLFEKMIVKSDENSLQLDAKKFKNCEDIEKIFIVNLVFETLKISLKDITRNNKNDIIDIIEGSNKRHLDLPYDLTLDKDNNIATFKINEKNVSMERRLKNGKTSFGEDD